MLSKMPRGILTIASRKRLESRKRLTPFRKDSRVINQFKPDCQDIFCQWVYKQRECNLLLLEEGETPQTITCLRFNFCSRARHGRGKFAKADVYLALAELLVAVIENDGLEYNKMVFYRYISSPYHSNLHVNFKSLKRQLQSMF